MAFRLASWGRQVWRVSKAKECDTSYRKFKPEFTLFFDRDLYFDNDTLRATLLVQSQDRFKYPILSVALVCHWESNDITLPIHLRSTTLYSHKKVLGEPFCVEPNPMTLHFEFKFPDEVLPPSFDSASGKVEWEVAVLCESPADPNALCMLHRLTFQKACLYYALDGHVPTVQAERVLDIPDSHRYTIVEKGVLSASASTTTLTLSRSYSQDQPIQIFTQPSNIHMEPLANSDGDEKDVPKGKEMATDSPSDASRAPSSDVSNVGQSCGSDDAQRALRLFGGPCVAGVDAVEGRKLALLDTAVFPPSMQEFGVMVVSDWKFEAELEPCVDWNADAGQRAACALWVEAQLSRDMYESDEPIEVTVRLGSVAEARLVDSIEVEVVQIVYAEKEDQQIAFQSCVLESATLHPASWKGRSKRFCMMPTPQDDEQACAMQRGPVASLAPSMWRQTERALVSVRYELNLTVSAKDGSQLHMTLPFNIGTSTALIQSAGSRNLSDFRLYPWCDEPPVYENHSMMSSPSWGEFMAHVFVPAASLKSVGVWTQTDPPEFEKAIRESRLLRWSV